VPKKDAHTKAVEEQLRWYKATDWMNPEQMAEYVDECAFDSNHENHAKAKRIHRLKLKQEDVAKRAAVRLTAKLDRRAQENMRLKIKRSEKDRLAKIARENAV
jgi:hypothetical protein